MNNLTLQEEFKAYITASGRKHASVAKAVGISSPTLSQWLNNKYGADDAIIEGKVRIFLQREKERQEYTLNLKAFVETSASKEFMEKATMCHRECNMAVIVGKAGFGKTTSAKYYRSNNPDSILVEVRPGFSQRMLLREIHNQLGLSGRGNVYDLTNDIIFRLTGSGQLLLIDEAELLPYEAIEILRRIWDCTERSFGLLLVGMPKLLQNIAGRRGEYEQLKTRIGLKVVLEPLRLEDTRAIIKAYNYPEAEELADYLHLKCWQNPRALSQILARIKGVSTMNDVKKISKNLIDTAASELMP